MRVLKYLWREWVWIGPETLMAVAKRKPLPIR